MKDFNVYALHIGIDVVDNGFYKNEFSELSGCVNDMRNMEQMIKSKYNGSLKEQVLLYAADGSENKETLPSTRNISKILRDWSTTLVEDDFLIITYAGHGTPVPDKNNDEKDNMDEAWVCYDRPLIDDQLNALFCKFKEGVKILIISDSCHSGTTSRGLSYKRLDEQQKSKTRYVPFETMKKILALNGELKKSRGGNLLESTDEPQASVKLLAACKDSEFAKEEGGEGVFTKNLKKAFAENNRLSYEALINKVRENMPIDQTPQIFDTGLMDLYFNNATFLEPEQGIVQKDVIAPIENASFKIDTNNIIVKSKTKGLNLYIENEKNRIGKVDVIPVINNAVNANLLNGSNSWDKAHHLLQVMSNNEAAQIDYIEPNILTNGLEETDIDGTRGDNNVLTPNKYLKTYPNPTEFEDDNPFIWHLSDQHSQLRKAFLSLHSQNYNLGIIPSKEDVATIGHIDTGVLPNHPTLPVNFDFEASDPNVEDVDATGIKNIGEQQGHGHGTVSILAGNKFDISNEDNFKGYYGAHPFAHIISYKVSETVAIFNAKQFNRAVKKAIKDNCDVITMSMAGLPSKQMAEAVNLAYENGIVIVSAASNSFVKSMGKILPKRTLYPARWDRVISAVGATYEKTPYLFYDQERNVDTRASTGAYMQMCYGPKEVLSTTLAAYAPNVVWFGSMPSSNKYNYYVKTGGGTSSATPQIAAAAALYIEKYRAELEKLSAEAGNKWKKAEVVRRALFDSAEKIKEYKDKFGNGILRAHDLINDMQFSPQSIFNKYNLKDAIAKNTCKEASINGNFLQRLIGVFRSRGAKKIQLAKEMLSTEILQLFHTDEKLQEYLDLDFTDADISDMTKEKIIEDIRNSSQASQTLKDSFKSLNIVSNRKTVDDSHTIIINNNDEIRLRGENCKFIECETKNVHQHDFFNTSYEVIDIEGELEITQNRSGVTTGIHIESIDAVNGTDNAIAAYVEIEVDGEKAGYWQFGQDLDSTNRGAVKAGKDAADYAFIDLHKVYEMEAVRGKGLLKKIVKFAKRIFKWKKQGKKAIENLLDLVVEQQNKLVIYDLENRKWIEEADLKPEVWARINKRKEICLLFHGLFSSVQAGYEDFFEKGFVNEALQKKFGQYLIGYNTADVVEGIADNANAFYDALKYNLKSLKKCTVLTRSRGGVVARYMFEELILRKRNPDIQLEKMIQIAPPNHGTPIANDAMYQKLLNITSLLFSKIPVVNFIMNPGVFMVLKYMAGEITALPGIDDLEVGSEVLQRLNEKQIDRSNYHIVISNYEPKRKIIKRLLDELAIDRFVFKKANNDGVVPVLGAFFQQPNGKLNGKQHKNFKIADVADAVSHFKYLENGTIQKQVCDWMTA